MDVMTILVLEETEGDLVHHQKILKTIPGVRLGLFADPAAAQKFYVENTVDVLVVDNDIFDGGVPWLRQTHIASGRRDVPVIMLGSNGDREIRRAAYEYGVYNVIEKPIDPPSYICIARNALSLQVMRRNDMLASQQVVEQMKVVQAQVEEREMQTIYGLLHSANLVDPALSRRMVKVAGVAAKIALRADALGAEDVRRFGIAARVYDIGMLALPANLRERRMELAGPDAGKLLGPHVQRAGEVFAKERSGLIELAATIARQHHERFDGRGYPDGLAGHDISIYAQLVAVAEMFNDVVTSGPYVGGGGRSQPLTEPQALAYIDRQSGTTFDPEVIDGLRRVIEAPIVEPPIPVRA